MRSAILSLTLTVLAAHPARADAIPYRLDPAASTVAFGYTLAGTSMRGTMPVAGADIALDFDRAAGSRVQVVLDVGAAEAGNPIATEAMRSPGVLDAAAHPAIRFESTAIRAAGQGAEVEGRLTIRGVTRPVRLAAEIYRPPGSAAGDLTRLTVVLRGNVARSDFGATGFADLVADPVTLDIVARLVRAD